MTEHTLNLNEWAMLAIFLIGYVFIAFEHQTKINKTAIALLMAITCWILEFLSPATNEAFVLDQLNHHVSNVSQIIFFLFGALTIVEVINAHKGFAVISNYFSMQSKKGLLWALGVTTFFISSILDNLTSTIIMVSLMQKLVHNRTDALVLGGAIVIAANAGGAWSPIGDVTTTMLWIGGQLSSWYIIKTLFIPSMVCLTSAMALLSFQLSGPLPTHTHTVEKIEPIGQSIFWLGIVVLLSVPVLKVTTGLSPFAGILLGVGIMWLVTDLLYRNSSGHAHLRVPHIITKIDLSGVLFFLGILLCVDALDTAALLHHLAEWVQDNLTHKEWIPILLGLFSAVIDNVPLVAATMGMYPLSVYPPDTEFWSLVAFCAGTGGSILIIGSAAGVAFMGLEKVEFFNYLRRVGFVACIAYFAGIGAFYLLK